MILLNENWALNLATIFVWSLKIKIESKIVSFKIGHVKNFGSNFNFSNFVYCKYCKKLN